MSVGNRGSGAAQRHLDVGEEAAVSLTDAGHARPEGPGDGRRRTEVLEGEVPRLDGEEVGEAGRREPGNVVDRQLLDGLAAQSQQRAAGQPVDVGEAQQAWPALERPAADGRHRLTHGRRRRAGVRAADVEDGRRTRATRRRTGADERDGRSGRAVGCDEVVGRSARVLRRRHD